MAVVSQGAEQGVDRFITTLGGAEALHDPPAIRDRELVGRKGFGRRGADRARIVLGHRIRQLLLHAGSAAAVDQGIVGGQAVDVHLQGIGTGRIGSIFRSFLSGGCIFVRFRLIFLQIRSTHAHFLSEIGRI